MSPSRFKNHPSFIHFIPQPILIIQAISSQGKNGQKGRRQRRQ